MVQAGYLGEIIPEDGAFAEFVGLRPVFGIRRVECNPVEEERRVSVDFRFVGFLLCPPEPACGPPQTQGQISVLRSVQICAPLVVKIAAGQLVDGIPSKVHGDLALYSHLALARETQIRCAGAPDAAVLRFSILDDLIQRYQLLLAAWARSLSGGDVLLWR